MKQSHTKILKALLENPRMSDRALAKLVGVSQPTISRTRAKMMKNELITFCAFPNLAEVGYKILAFTEVTGLVHYLGDSEDKLKMADYKEKLQDNSSVIYAVVAPGKLFIISAHHDIVDYDQFKAECMHFGRQVESRYLTTTSLVKIVKPLQFSSLINSHIEKWRRRARDSKA